MARADLGGLVAPGEGLPLHAGGTLYPSQGPLMSGHPAATLSSVQELLVCLHLVPWRRRAPPPTGPRAVSRQSWADVLEAFGLP